MAFMLNDGKTMIYTQYFNKNNKIYYKYYNDSNTHNYMYVLKHNDQGLQRLNYLEVLTPEEIEECLIKYNKQVLDLIKIKEYQHCGFVNNYFQTESINKKLKPWQINDLQEILTHESSIKTVNTSFSPMSPNVKVYHNISQSGKSFVLMELSSYYIKYKIDNNDMIFTKTTVIVTPHKTVFSWRDRLKQNFTKPYYVVDTKKNFEHLKDLKYQIVILSDKYYSDFIEYIKDNKILVNRLVFDSYLNLDRIITKPDNVIVSYLVSNNFKNFIIPFSNSFLDTKNFNNRDIFLNFINSIYYKFDNLITLKTRLTIINQIIKSLEPNPNIDLPHHINNIFHNFNGYFDINKFNEVEKDNRLNYLNSLKLEIEKEIGKYNREINNIFLGNSYVDPSIYKQVTYYSIKPKTNQENTNASLSNLIINNQFIDIINIFNIKTNTITEIVDKYAKNKTEEIQHNLKQRICTKQCLICFEKPEIEIVTDCCQNLFCMACYMTCVQSTPKCPMCRCPIDITKNIIIKDTFKDQDKLKILEPSLDIIKKYSEFHSREDNFSNILSYIKTINPDPKILIVFTDYTYYSYDEFNSKIKRKFLKSKEYQKITRILEEHDLTYFNQLCLNKTIELNLKHLNANNSDLINAFIFNNSNTYHSFDNYDFSFNNIQYVIYYNDYNRDRLSYFSDKRFKYFKKKLMKPIQILGSVNDDKPVEVFYIHH